MGSTHLKKIYSQIGSFPQVGVKIKKHLKPPPVLHMASQCTAVVVETNDTITLGRGDFSGAEKGIVVRHP